MSKFEPITFNEEYANMYWDGASNTFVRYYSYLDRGFELFNKTKNYLMLMFGTYWTIKTMDWWVQTGYSEGILIFGLIVVATFGIGFLVLIGRWHLFKAAQAIEYITQLKGTVTQYKGFNMAVYQLRLFEALAQERGIDTKKIFEDLKLDK